MIELATISSNGSRPSIFGSSVSKGRTFHPTLGQPAPADWYSRGQAALAKFDELSGRQARIADAGERARILAWMGDPAKSGTPAYRYFAVQADAGAAQRAGNTENYSNGNVTDRVLALEDSVRQLDTMVTNAETAFGQLAVSTESAAQPAPAKPDWTTPVLIGAAVVAAGLVVAKLARGGRR